MEILIAGLILVALMAYASTRIKRIAAKAFEAETVQTEQFVIQKPDGFLNIVNGDPQFAFEAYSMEFGTGDASAIRLGTATIKISDAGSDADLAGTEIASDIKEVISEKHYRLIEGKRVNKETELRVLYKIAESQGKVFVLEITILPEAPDEFSRKVESMLDSFEIK
jgi:hypothetical protein